MYPKEMAGQIVWCQIGSAISNPITNRKVSDTLKIDELSTAFASSLGGERVILLCNKVNLDEKKLFNSIGSIITGIIFNLGEKRRY